VQKYIGVPDGRNKKNLILEFLRECPYKIALSNCPLKKIRKLSVLKKFKIVGAMSKQDTEEALEYHKKCFKERKRI